jgi:uncharacterized DUF497 family protein
MQFTWDPKKNRANQRKHDGISFTTAERVFDGPNYVVEFDRIDEEGRERYHAIGPVQAVLLVVVHIYIGVTQNGEEIVRIISARKASREEFQ